MNIDRIKKLEEENENIKKWLDAIIELFHELQDDIDKIKEEK